MGGASPPKQVGREQALARAVLHDVEGVRAAQQLPHLHHLPPEGGPEQGGDVGAGVVVALRPYPRSSRRVVAVGWMVQRQIHKALEGDPAALGYLAPYDPQQLGVTLRLPRP
ncbi:hypothetical protein [Thermobaculum terrenum]|uniref:hypothetical protein n=1 Tax=Thermobaculum terrenum TaxID=166501 RepID=UPI001F49962C|nr:hypothetical protein [Thermobaculum terrenum]